MRIGGTIWKVESSRFFNGLGNKIRHLMCHAYIAGLIGPGDRKSTQSMAARADVDHFEARSWAGLSSPCAHDNDGPRLRAARRLAQSGREKES